MLAVVSDSSPLVYLTRLGRLELLHRLYEQVLIPPAVWREIAVEGAARPEGACVRQAVAERWLQVESVAWETGEADGDLLALDEGEREAIALARQKQAMLIIDECEGREVARRLGVPCTGTLGVLVEAKLRGLIPELKAELLRLQAETNFRFTEDLFAAALRKAGEDRT